MAEKALKPIEPALRDLAQARTVPEIKQVRDRAHALESYAREARDPELIDHAVEVRLRAERKAGEILRQMGERGERETRGGDRRSNFREARLKLADLGLTEKQSFLWQKLAALAEAAFLQRLKNAKTAAVAAIEMTAAERQVEKRERRETRERELGAKQLADPAELYGLIVADDEWDHEVWSRETGMDRHASNHYPTASEAHSAEEMHERTRARFTPADDCVLAMWTTNQHLAVAMKLMERRGFRYVSNYCWGKDKIGLGYWNREKHELLLIGVRGSPPAPAPGTQWESLIIAPRGEHSAKPECFLEMFESYFPTLPKIEINRRGPPRPGWDSWGWEAGAAGK